MAKASSARNVPRDWRRVALVGAVCFALAFAPLYFLLPAGAVMAASKPVASVVGAGFAALLAMAVTLILLTGRLRAHNRRMRIALNNMSQGLCMFDRNERLLVCNHRYAEMYNLPPAVTKPGTTLTDLLEYRVANGSFSRDIEEYRRELLAVDRAGRLPRAGSQIRRRTRDPGHQPADGRRRLGGDA